MAAIQYFLGANTPKGFHSLYDELIDRDSARAVYILKGGPGCGKSSFLRRIGRHAEAAGLNTQYILCSGDPESLDALILPELNTALVDGTAPHVVEPICPGVVDHYINLGRHYDSAALQVNRSEILARSVENKAAYHRCYRCLSSVGALDEDIRDALFTQEARLHLQKRARGIIARELKGNGNQSGRVTRRFLSAVTCNGCMTLWDTVTAQCTRIYELFDNYGFAHELLISIQNAAAAHGYDVIACPTPMSPNRLEHILIPDLELAFVTSSKELPYPNRPYRRLHLDTMLTAEDSYPQNRPRARFAKKVSSTLLTEGIHALKQAKQAHDALEALYNPYVDFSAVYQDADTLAQALISNALTASP